MGGALREFLALGIFIGGCGLLMLPFQPPNSAPFVLSALSALIGGVLVGAVIYVQKRFLRSDEDDD
ncbi:MAG: hypothetical protein MUC99_10390 [Anaerolineae bacterium]|jgi:hypothetical protein|nr:hypothetical protein [Anaerolineae bacterium]